MPREGPTPRIGSEEVKVAPNGMAIGNVLGPGGILVKVWKCLRDESLDILFDLTQKINLGP